jgi:hypothetical protein
MVQPAVNNATGAGLQFVLRAIMQLLSYDGVIAMEGGYEPVADAIPPAPGADVRAAAAAGGMENGTIAAGR